MMSSNATFLAEHVHVSRPPEEVFTLLTDLRRLPEWASSVVETRGGDTAAVATGRQFQQVAKVLGMRIEIDVEVTAVEPGRSVSYAATGAHGAWARMTQRVHPEEAGCRVEVELEYILPWGVAGRLAGRAFGERVNERVAQRSLVALKKLAEGSPVDPDAVAPG